MGYLTAPVNNLADFQAEYNGVLLGPSTAYQFVDGTPDFMDMAPVRTMETKRIWSAGSFAGPDFPDVLLPSFTLGVNGPDVPTFQASVQALQNLLTIGAGTGLPFWFKPPGLAARGLIARVNKRHMPMATSWNSGLAEAQIQLRAPDPDWQSAARSISLVASGSNVSGLVFPIFNVNVGTYVAPGVADFGATGTGASSGTLTNAGNAPAWPVVGVPGPSTGFTIQIAGGYVTYSGTLLSSDTLSIDYSTGLATLNGAVDRTTLLTSRQYMPVPAGGTATAFFTATAGTCSITSADIWR